jgi:hypothetical protein
MSKKIFGIILGAILIGIGLFPLKVVKPQPKPSINLDVDKPSDEILKITEHVNKLITDDFDRTKLAVFNYCFSKRISNYSTVDSQKLNDVYVLAAEYYFGDTMKGKYTSLGEELTKLFENILGDKNHVLSEDEKVKLKNTFGGLAWSLIQ